MLGPSASSELLGGLGFHMHSLISTALSASHASGHHSLDQPVAQVSFSLNSPIVPRSYGHAPCYQTLGGVGTPRWFSPPRSMDGLRDSALRPALGNLQGRVLRLSEEQTTVAPSVAE
jgi:hypothetical protein